MRHYREANKADKEAKNRKCYICHREGHEAEKCWGEPKNIVRNRECVIPVKRMYAGDAYSRMRDVEISDKREKMLKDDEGQAVRIRDRCNGKKTEKNVDRSLELRDLVRKFPNVLGNNKERMKWCGLEK